MWLLLIHTSSVQYLVRWSASFLSYNTISCVLMFLPIYNLYCLFYFVFSRTLWCNQAGTEQIKCCLETELTRWEDFNREKNYSYKQLLTTNPYILWAERRKWRQKEGKTYTARAFTHCDWRQASSLQFAALYIYKHLPFAAGY